MCKVTSFFVYNNYVRRCIKSISKVLYFGIYFGYYGFLLYDMRDLSSFINILSIVLCALLIILPSIIDLIFRNHRINIIAPFTPLYAFEYDFKTFHILTKKVTDLIKVHCDESEELISE